MTCSIAQTIDGWVEDKTSYIELFDGLVIGAGVYK